MNDTTPTAVIFRKWRLLGDVIALFPEVPGDSDLSTCSSYALTDGHGAASADLNDVTFRAEPEEYAETLRALVRIGYNLRVVRRRTRAMDNKRWNEIRRVRA